MLFNFQVPLYLAAESATEQVVVSGHGADELFGGYHRYKKMNDKEFLRKSKEDVLALAEGDAGDARALVASAGHMLSTPYLDPNIIEYGLGLPRASRTEKKIIHDLVEELGFSPRKKKAAQFGSGSAKLLTRIAKKEGVSEEELIQRYAVSP